MDLRKNKLLFWLATGVSVSFTALFIYTAIKLNKVKSQLSVSISTQKETERDLQLCNHGLGKLLLERTTVYSSEESPISSPLFEGKEMIRREWTYQTNKINETVIILPLGTSYGSNNVIVWEQLHTSNSLSYVFTSGRADLIDRSPSKNLYLSKTGLSFNRGYNELSTYIELSSAHQLYIQIIGNQVFGLPDEENKQNYTDDSLIDLEKIADTISISIL